MSGQSGAAASQPDRAEQFLLEAVRLLDALGAQHHIAQVLCFAGILAVAQGRDARGTRLVGAASTYAMVRASLDADELRDWDAHHAQAQTRLGDEDFQEVWLEGQAMGLEAGVVHVLAGADAAREASRMLPPARRWAR